MALLSEGFALSQGIQEEVAGIITGRTMMFTEVVALDHFAGPLE